MNGCMAAGRRRALARALLTAWSCLAAGAAETAKAPDRAAVDAAIRRGVDFLLQQQNPAGWWSTADHPGVTGLVLTALNREPSGRLRPHRTSELNRAYDFLLSSARPDGAIHRGQLANYNTALSLLALSTADDPRFLPVIRAARAYLAGTQIDFGEPGKPDTPFDGGVGYGSRYLHSDMNNTIWALEAMRWSEAALPRDENQGRPVHDLNWQAAIHFLQNCQNLPGKNDAEWVSHDPKDRGGFVYYPGHTKAQSVTNPATGRVALRSYGSISYAGLLSYIYARLDRDDPRVAAVLDWLRDNYSLEENPGMGAEGYFYYLHLMTKALTAARVDALRPREEQPVNWRAEVAARLLARQRADGAWVNTEADRWWEGDPNLVTAYSLLALEMLRGHLPPG